jgi:hypothetical protein
MEFQDHPISCIEFPQVAIFSLDPDPQEYEILTFNLI